MESKFIVNTGPKFPNSGDSGILKEKIGNAKGNISNLFNSVSNNDNGKTVPESNINIASDKIEIGENITVFEKSKAKEDSDGNIVTTQLKAASGNRQLNNGLYRLDVFQTVDVNGEVDKTRSGPRKLIVDKSGNEITRFNLDWNFIEGVHTRTEYNQNDVPTGSVSSWGSDFSDYNKVWTNPKDSSDWARLDVQNVVNHQNGLYTLTVTKTTSGNNAPATFTILMDSEGNELSRSDG